MKKAVKYIIISIILIVTIYSFFDISFIEWLNNYFILFGWFLCSLLFFIYNYDGFNYLFVDLKKKKFILKKEKKIKKFKNIEYYRDIPFNGDIFKVYYIMYQYNLIDDKTDLIGAFLLNLIRKGGAVLTNDGEGIYIDFDKIDLAYASEFELIKILKEASKDNVLGFKELKKWVKKHRKVLKDWSFNVIDNQMTYFKRINMIYEKKGKLIISSELTKEAEKIIGFKKFLLDFSNIDDREVMEVKLWKMYLVMAQLLGISDKVIKEFKNKSINNYDVEKLTTFCKMSGSGILRFLVIFSSLFDGFLLMIPAKVYISILFWIVKLINSYVNY